MQKYWQPPAHHYPPLARRLLHPTAALPQWLLEWRPRHMPTLSWGLGLQSRLADKVARRLPIRKKDRVNTDLKNFVCYQGSDLRCDELDS